MLSINEFYESIWSALKSAPAKLRKGQAVFNTVEELYGEVARDVQFIDGVDCFYDNSQIDNFLEKVYNRLSLRSNEVLFSDNDCTLERFKDGDYRLSFFENCHWHGDIILNKDSIKTESISDDPESFWHDPKNLGHFDLMDTDRVLIKSTNGEFSIKTLSQVKSELDKTYNTIEAWKLLK